MKNNRSLAYALAAVGILLSLWAFGTRAGQIVSLSGPPAMRSDELILFTGDYAVAYFRAVVVLEVKVEPTVTIEPSDSTTIAAVVTLQSVRIEASGSGSFDQLRDVPAGMLEGVERNAKDEVERLLREGKLGLTLELAGADVKPNDVAPIVGGRAEWSVKATTAGNLKGFVSPLVKIVEGQERFNDRERPGFALSSVTTSQRQMVELRSMQSGLGTTIRIGLAILGSLATIPGIYAFYLDIRRRREERERLARDERQRAEQEQERKRKERKIVVTGEDPRD